MQRARRIAYQTSLVFLTLCVSLFSVTSVRALGFANPAELSNRQKAHLNISFTGTGVAKTTTNSCSASGLDLSGNFSLGKDPKERRVNLVKAFMSYGLSPEQAAGPVGNFMWESGGTDVPPNHNEFEPKVGPPNSDQYGYGWAQWSFGRKTAFVKFMKDHGFVDNDGSATDAANFK